MGGLFIRQAITNPGLIPLHSLFSKGEIPFCVMEI